MVCVLLSVSFFEVLPSRVKMMSFYTCIRTNLLDEISNNKKNNNKMKVKCIITIRDIPVPMQWEPISNNTYDVYY